MRLKQQLPGFDAVPVRVRTCEFGECEVQPAPHHVKVRWQDGEDVQAWLCGEHYAEVRELCGD